MRKVFFRLLSWVVMVLLWTSPAHAGFEFQAQKTIDLGSGAMDIAVSQDGKWTFVLTSDGEVRVFTWTGELVQILKVEKGYNSVEFSQAGNRLILGSVEGKAIKIILLELVHQLDITGSPYKGPDNAPVVVAVFDDFQ